MSSCVQHIVYSPKEKEAQKLAIACFICPREIGRAPKRVKGFRLISFFSVFSDRSAADGRGSFFNHDQ
ncbi:hypothetical protein GUJ93_ZPchr0009g420 [Zizania palustris]|uniref:Uncharacterized protein n=1 Tax=Zizania palustris TaxID=103762 RepID=A0A8J5RSZ3_ZIZPA|nr:hypothetical protein GUJ93_ZPchr0009g420 [Zizania palustris]